MTNQPERDIRQALQRVFLLKCPACGQGRVLQGYLKVKHSCETCGLALHNARTDDGPAYFTLCIVIAFVFPLFPILYSVFDPKPWAVALTLTIIGVGLGLLLLPRIKGVFIGLQWANRRDGL